MDKARRFDKICAIMGDEFDKENYSNGVVLQDIAFVLFEDVPSGDITEEQALDGVKKYFAQAKTSNSLIQNYVSVKKGIERLYTEQMDEVLG